LLLEKEKRSELGVLTQKIEENKLKWMMFYFELTGLDEDGIKHVVPGLFHEGFW
jgi:hypothetical protein